MILNVSEINKVFEEINSKTNYKLKVYLIDGLLNTVYSTIHLVIRRWFLKRKLFLKIIKEKN
ncbi:MAG: hypothetical protein BWY55_00173 [archaeon ADurb.Bin336]|jgi:hypothetical protein|nr:MAG: hypothetical protein BWY55_00173 [archaeon ADurb.Bin336]